MTKRLSQDDFLDILKKGVARTTNLIARLTDYHGGPVETEYLITTDIFRELVERELDAKVEYLNRRLINAMNILTGSKPQKVLRSKRTDIVVVDHFATLAMIEVKIRVSSLAGIRKDLDKITQTISLMKGSSAAKVIGASVFQIHIRGARHRFYAEQFKAKADRLEKRIADGLATYAASHTDFALKLHSLQPEGAGIVGRDLDLEGDDLVWGADGHATRYHAILIRSTRPIEPDPFELLAARQRSRSGA